MKIEIKIENNKNINRAYYFYVGKFSAMLQSHMLNPLYNFTPIKYYKTIRLLAKIHKIKNEIVELNK